jgi:hypothetical protein
VCDTAGHDSDCLTMDLRVFERQPDGSRKKIKDPGLNYSGECLVTDISPEPGTKVNVPGTVTIEVECTPVEAAPAEQPVGP